MKCELNVHSIEIHPFDNMMFYSLLAIDGDFSENENMYREDTIELGFRNEAERVSKELAEQFRADWERICSEEESDDEVFMELISEYLEKAVHSYANDSQFIIGNDTYVSQYEIRPIFPINESLDYGDDITVIISYITT